MVPPSQSEAVLTVIMANPVGPEGEAKRSAIAEAAGAAGWLAGFPDFDENDVSIETFIAPFRSARHILADLTGERPSCYFELGLVEALNLSITACAATGTHIHQSSHSRRVRFYPDLAELKRIVTDVCVLHSHSIVPGGFEV